VIVEKWKSVEVVIAMHVDHVDEVNDCDESFGSCKKCGNPLYSFSQTEDRLCYDCDKEDEK